jgi:formate dehydrogenase iron-sulfur subunit
MNTPKTGREEGAAPARTLNRREFVRRAGIGLAAVAAGAVLTEHKVAQASSAAPHGGVDDDAVGVLIDLTRCTGCNSCALACKAVNDMPNPETPPAALSSKALTFIAIETDAAGETHNVKRQCMHCLHPACVSACTVGALRKRADGPVVYDAHKCIGCRYCQYACPFGVPTYDWNNPLGLVHKCQLCFQQRVAKDETPACVEACPNGALRFGKRRVLLAQAHAEIAGAPTKYIDHVYGEHEAGGTSMLYLSAVPFEQLRFPQLGNGTISQAAEAVMGLTPAVALSVATLATGLHLLLRRRQQKDDAAPIAWSETKED